MYLADDADQLAATYRHVDATQPKGGRRRLGHFASPPLETSVADLEHTVVAHCVWLLLWCW